MRIELHDDPARFDYRHAEAMAASLLAGLTIAPVFSCQYALVGRSVASGTETEAFTWVALATTIGASIGSALVGPLVEAAGWRAGALVAVALPAVATLIVFARRDLIV